MKRRQIKKFMETYVLDVDDETLVPPSICREEARSMEKYFQKGWIIANPEKAEEINKAIEEARAEAEEKCGCGCGCGCDCDCDDHKDHECECDCCKK